MSAALTSLVFAALTAVPGLLLADRFLADRPGYERRALGLAAGLALGCIAAYLAALVGHVFAVFAVVGLAVLLLAYWRVARPVAAAAHAPQPFDWTGLLAVVAASLWFALPLLRQPMPQGWDPAFHTTLVELIRTQGGLPATWAPYEPADRFNYPSGFHALVAASAGIGGAPSEIAFAWAFVLVGVLQLTVVHALGRRFGKGPAAGAIAVLCYGLTSGWGTPNSHVAWGGLPNLAGLGLMGAFLLLVSRPSRSATALAAACAAAAAFVHHLSFVLLGFCVAGWVVVELVSERRLSRPSRHAFLAMAAATLTAGLLVMLNPKGRYEVGQGLRFEGESLLTLNKIVDAMGAPFLAIGLAGLVLALWSHRDEAMRILPTWAIGLLSFWGLWDVVYRGAVWFLKHENYTAFTPSRGLTDAAVPLALCAGVLFERLAERIPFPKAAKALPLAVGLLWAGLGATGELARWRDPPASAPAFDGARAFCAKLQEAVPAEAVIFAPNAGEVGIWLPYLCAREFNYFPEPTYGMSEYRERKARIQDPREFSAFIAQRESRPTYFASRGRRTDLPAVFSAGGWNLYSVPR